MKYLLAILIALGSIFGYQNSDSLGTAPRILTGQQGGTGIGTAAAGDVGKFLKVSDDSPLTYVYDTASGGSGAGNSKWATSTNTTDIQPNSGQGLNVTASSTFVGNLFARSLFGASSTALFTNGSTAYSSSTFQGITATLGRFLDTFQASSTALFGQGFTSYASSSLQNFTGVFATTSQATTTNLYVSTSATSTFGGGIFLSTGCIANADGCLVGGSGGSGTVNSGIFGQLAFYSGNGTAISGTTTIVVSTTTSQARVGISTTSPVSTLDVGGFINVHARNGYQQNGRTILFASSTNSGLAIGPGAGIGQSSASTNNTSIGTNAGAAITTGTDNMFQGTMAGNQLTTGSRNVGIGSSNFLNGSGVNDSTASGYLSLRNASASENTAMGSGACQGVSGSFSGANNACFGYRTANQISSGGNNVFLGHNSGLNLSSGSFNISLGANIDLPSNTTNGQLNIGNLLYGTSVHSSTVVSSAPVIGRIGIATTTPFATLSVSGGSLQSTPLFAVSTSTAIATSTAFLIDSMGNVAIGTTSPQYMLEVASAATTTVRVDSRHGLKGSCLMLRDTDGVGFTYVYVNDGVLTASQTPCN